MKKILMFFVMMACLTVNSIAQKSDFFTKGEAEYSNKNYEEAVKWYEKAADEGVADAMYMLGECYMGGKGVDKDESTAFNWYKRAADNENRKITAKSVLKYGVVLGTTLKKENVGKCSYNAYEEVARGYEHGIGTEIDLHAATDYWIKSYEYYKERKRDNSAGRSAYHAGICFQFGKPSDMEEADKWYKKAEKLVNPETLESLKSLKETQEMIVLLDNLANTSDGNVFSIDLQVPSYGTLEDNIVVLNMSEFKFNNIRIYSNGKEIASGCAIDANEREVIKRFDNNFLASFAGKTLHIEFESVAAATTGKNFGAKLYEADHDICIEISNNLPDDPSSDQCVRTAPKYPRENVFYVDMTISEKMKIEDNFVVKNSTLYLLDNVRVYYNNAEVATGSMFSPHTSETIQSNIDNLSSFLGKSLRIEFGSKQAYKADANLNVMVYENNHDLYIEIYIPGATVAVQTENTGGFWNGMLKALEVTSTVLEGTSNALNEYNNLTGKNNTSVAPTSSGSYNSSVSSSSASSSASERSSEKIIKDVPCDKCCGTGKCFPCGPHGMVQYCNGSGKCGYCHGRGIDMEYVGHDHICNHCKGKKNCQYCNGSGKCSKCHGSGKKTVDFGYVEPSTTNEATNNNSTNNTVDVSKQLVTCDHCKGSGACVYNGVYNNGKIVVEVKSCGGTGRCAFCSIGHIKNGAQCKHCHGTRTCNYCHGTKKCSKCNGFGKILRRDLDGYRR